MFYCGKEMNIKEYFDTRMKEDGFVSDDIEQIDGYYRSEAIYNIIADYHSSCNFETVEELDFIKKLGFSVEDFEDETNDEEMA